MALLDRFTREPAWRRGAGDDATTLGEPRVEPGPEMFKRQDRSEVEIAEALRQQWEREGVTSGVRRRDVGPATRTTATGRGRISGHCAEWTGACSPCLEPPFLLPNGVP